MKRINVNRTLARNGVKGKFCVLKVLLREEQHRVRKWNVWPNMTGTPKVRAHLVKMMQNTSKSQHYIQHCSGLKL